MSVYQDPELDQTEKLIRIGCGALLGVFLGIYLDFEFEPGSFAMNLIIVILSAMFCAFLAFKYGDEFWHEVIEYFKSP